MGTKEFKKGYKEAYDDFDASGMSEVIERELLMGDHEGSEWLSGYRKAMYELLENGPIDVVVSLPRLPDGWEYSGKYRKPKKGEYFLYCGEVKCSCGRQALPYHIMVRSE